MDSAKDKIKELKILVVVPTYNNATTLRQVVDSIREYSNSILIINDGSTDDTQKIIEELGVDFVSYSPNKGKGYAIKRAFKYAKEHSFDYVLSIDSDLQHYASDIVNFVEEIEKHPDSLLIGNRNLLADNMPKKNSFANKFSNFWYFVETAEKLSDTQSGYRIYPMRKIADTKFYTNRYEFEVEVIVRSSWKGVNVKNIPINVYYPPESERVSHFKPAKDFARISVLNTVLVLLALFYYLPRKLLMALSVENLKSFFNKYILSQGESNFYISASISLGVLCGLSPLWGIHTITVFVLAHILKLSKTLSFLASNISMPITIPFIVYFSMYLGGKILRTDMVFNFDDISIELVYDSICQYIIGSVSLALISSVLIFLASYILLFTFRKSPNG